MSPYRKVVLAQAIGQGSVLLATPVLSRLVPVAELGTYQVALAIALTVQPIVTLRVDFVLPSIRRNDEALRLLHRARRAGLVVLAVSVMAAGVLLLVDQVHLAEISLLSGVLAIAYSWLALDGGQFLRTRELGALATRNLVSGLAAAVLQCVFVLWIPTAVALACAIVMARVAAVGLSRTQVQNRPIIEPGSQDVIDHYPTRRMVRGISMSLLDTSILQSFVVVPGATLGAEAAGYTGMAQRIVTSPASLVVGGLGQVAQARVSARIQAGGSELVGALKPIVWRLATVALVLGLGVSVVGPLLVVPVLGPSWSQLETLLPITAPALAMQLVSLPLAPIGLMLHAETRLVVLNVARLALTVGGSVVVALATGELLPTVAWWSATTAVGYACQLAVILVAARKWSPEL